MKKFAAAVMAALLLLTSTNAVSALTDDYVLNDEVRAVYQGRDEARDMMTNLRFTDVAASHWAGEAIARAGALNLVKGTGTGRYSPSGNVTNEQALAFVLRAMGRERDALAQTALLQRQAPEGSSASTLWSIGYLNLAMQLGMITAMDYTTALAGGDVAEGMFDRTAAASRERIGYWIYMGLRAINANAFNASGSVQTLLNFSDWSSISPEYLPAMEAVTAAKIFQGSNGRLSPKSAITRAEMAQVMKNMEKTYLPLAGLEVHTGTVGAVRDNQYTTTNTAALWRNIYIRVNDGSMEVLQYNMGQQGTIGGSPQTTDKDAIVRKNGSTGGLGLLAEGDVVEYIVQPNGAVWYVQVLSSGVQQSAASAMLYQVDVEANTIALRDKDGKIYLYSLIDYLLQTEGNTTTLQIGGVSGKGIDVTKLPYGSGVRLVLKNGVATEVHYVGEPVAVQEIRGIVTENNPLLGYITFIDNNGKSVTKSYYEDDLMVEKSEHYMVNDDIGYIDQVFPHFEYDPRDTNIASIEPGDIIFVRMAPGDSSRIIEISAATNYTMKYGKVRTMQANDGYTSFLIEYEDKQTAWYDAVPGVFVSREGKPIPLSGIQIGDWVKLLVNEAILAPGHIMESVKEITVEGGEHFISTIVKGSLASVDAVQRKLVLQGAETLAKTGWTDYRDLLNLSLAGNDVEYYYGNTRVSLEYVNHYLKNTGVLAYVALENHFTGERVKKVTFRPDRERVLDADTVINANGAGRFDTLSGGVIMADEGTIVVRHGRLVSAQDILVPDYAKVILNGANSAAVVDISAAPDTSQLMIARGRVLSVEESRSFKVQSMSVLSGTKWVYTPVQRDFAIDGRTVFLNEDGYVSRDTFIGYTDDSVIDNVYNIVVDGSRAAYVVDSPYAQYAVRGTIYRTEDDTLYLRNASVLNNTTGQWNVLHSTNSIMQVTYGANTLVGRDNTIVLPRTLGVGDEIMVFTASLPAARVPGMEVAGTIIMVER